MRNVVMAVFGLRHTVNTIVGDHFIRGVSGGERKRVSIAEMALSRAPFACWDNSTRGLDAASALDFVQCLRLASNMVGSSSAVAIYQASQTIYEQFDKVTVLYEGREGSSAQPLTPSSTSKLWATRALKGERLGIF